MRFKQPRVHDEKHLKWIRGLPCVICGCNLGSDPAHLKAANLDQYNKPQSGTMKPDDKWTTPLCRKHHDEQHSMGEIRFWVIHGIRDPWLLCKRLYAASGNQEEGEAIIRSYRPRTA